MSWDPNVYLQFEDQRLRPGMDLIARIPVTEPASVVDLGCGTGRLTRVLAERWPSADFVGIDSSREMLAQTTSHSQIRFEACDIVDWSPAASVDVIFSNAALHWVGHHDVLFGRLLQCLTPGGVLAVQMPDNFAEPTHEVIRTVANLDRFRAEVGHLAPGFPVSSPAAYRQYLSEAARVDQWDTIYHQALGGEDPVLRWTMGSVMRPVLDALEQSERDAFIELAGALYREAYPPEPDGVTMLPFRRRFIVAVRA